ncbi:alanine racemase [Leptotrichia sp. OH3620_COT-345]|uniref:alanine racemase n=1 Tax=Leptotrichia sp. OH3620_COT-345 TaxID=2491048 RepID=UPI000F64EC77|nr:alanine racemase [Leptotrichia sp. OH3620_COT-345]RRD39717.1 alanine racemase [Leptotrichia sp. OH3620_COT-345]
MRCWAEINIKNLYENIKELEKITSKEHIMAVIKADAYGHGMLKICNLLIKKGILNFAVATADEALEIRKMNESVNILILGPIENDYVNSVSEKNIYFTVTDFEEIDYLEKNHCNVDVFIKIDTGMGRVGFQSHEIEKMTDILKNCKYVRPIGVFSHFSSSDSDGNYTDMQSERFEEISEIMMKEISTIKYRHLHNSFGSLKSCKKKYDFIRVGIIAYGGVTEKETVPYKFKPVMSLYAKISYIKTLHEDSYISYGNTYLGKKGETLATVSIGYADGVRRELSNSGYVYYKGFKCRIVGRVCMDQLIILLPEILVKKAKKGDIVEFFGENISAVEVADICGTISYEILCGISQRVPRIYINENE